MLLAPNKTYENEPFELEADLESAILEVRKALFGKERIYSVELLSGEEVAGISMIMMFTTMMRLICELGRFCLDWGKRGLPI